MERDPQLVRRCLAGDDSAWESLVKAHARGIYNLCYRFTDRTADAEDLTQEVFVKVFKSLSTWDLSQSSFSTWLHRVARNHLVDHYRRTKHDRATRSLEDELPTLQEKSTPADSPAAPLEARERKELLQQALNKLSPEMREAVILRDLQDLDYGEIAQALGIAVGTVKSRINRGRLELARVLKRMQGMRRSEGAGASHDAPGA